jgi:hypothetical protein
MSAVIDALQRLLASPYLWELDQYRAAAASYRGAQIVRRPNPPNPFTDGEAGDLVHQLIDDDRFPDTDEAGGRIAYMVFLPKGTMTPNYCGAHGCTRHEDPPAWFAWIGYDSVDGMTSCFTHELAELMTSPELDAWYVGGVKPDDSEIGDLCDITNGWVDGVFVRAYWSDRDQKCVIPTDGRMVQIDGLITPGEPRQVDSGPFTPPAPSGIDHFVPTCHFEGKTYTWTLSEVDETAELDATAEFFNTPAFEWSVGGAKLSPGSGRVSITVDVTRQAAAGSSTGSETVSLAYRANSAHLELRNDSVAGNMDVPVTVTVYDQAGAARPENPIRSTVTVAFNGSILTIPDYERDVERCQRAALEFWKETHKQRERGPIGPLGESDRELLASQPGWVSAEQLRRATTALIQTEDVKSVDDAAGEALRTILLEGARVDGLQLERAEH